jgi:hypothetical protein
LHQDTKSTGYLNACGTAAPIISPGQEHEINFGEDITEMLPVKGVSVGDTVFSEILGYGRVVHTPMEGIRVVPCNQQKDCRGFCSRKLFEQFMRNNTLFTIRIKSKIKVLFQAQHLCYSGIKRV